MSQHLDHDRFDPPDRPDQPSPRSDPSIGSSKEDTTRRSTNPGVASSAADATSEKQALLATLERLGRNVMSLLGAAAVSVSLLDRHTGHLTPWVAMDAGADTPRPLYPNPYADVEQWVATHLTPALIGDLRAETRVLEQFPSLQALMPLAYANGAADSGSLGTGRSAYDGVQGAPIRSLLCAPLMDGDHILGALTVVSQQPDAFDTTRQRLMQVFSEQAALAVSKTVQAEANAAQARELSALLDASRALTSSLEPTQVFSYIVASIRKVINCDDAVIYVRDPGAAQLRVVAGMGPRGDRLGGARISLDDPHSIAAWVANNKRAQLSSAGQAAFGAVTETFLSGDDLSLLCVPLISKSNLRGVIMLARAQAFRPGELAAMLNLSNIVAATLENVELFQQARAEREQQAAIFASASDGFAIADDKLNLSEVNEAFARMVGQPREQLLGQRLCMVFQRRSSGACRLCGESCLVAQALQRGEANDHIECEFPAGLGTGGYGGSQPGFASRPSQPEFLARPSQPGQSSRPSQPGYEGARHTPGGVDHVAQGALPAPATYRVTKRTPVASARIPRRYVDFSVTPIMSADSPRALLVGRDVTAMREMDQIKSNFLSMVSHELRGPLQTINGYLDLALDGMGGELSEQLDEFLRRARAGSEHLTSLVDDLLLLSRRDAGQFVLFPHETDLAPIIREAVEEMEIAAEDAEVRLIVDTPETLPPVMADGPRITQVVRNLLTNAIKFTPAGGVVMVTAEATDEQVIMRVRDTGIGIAPEHLPNIFERFYQVGEATSRGKAQGQGLGLAIVRIIVDGHDGALNVTSEPRKGSEFTVALRRV